MTDVMTPLERRVEALELCARLAPIECLTTHEREFLTEMSHYWRPVSTTQLQWLRDMNQKYNGDLT